MSAADAAFARALEQWQAESLQAAHAACMEALGHDADHVGAAVLASEVLLRVGEPRPAVALLAQVVRRAPDDGAALLLLARAQRSAGELEAAERSARAARRRVAASPDGAGEAAAEHALTLLALGRAEEAAEALEVAAAAAGDDARAHWVVADTLLRVGDGPGGDEADRGRRARGAFARAVELDPDAATWHAVEALRCGAAGRPEEARGLIARGLALMPGDAELEHMAAAADGRSPQRASERVRRGPLRRVRRLVRRRARRAPGLPAARPHLRGAGAARRPRGGGGRGGGCALDVLDAGCGTGLCAARLRPLARRLAGLDLSERMVARARALGLYDELVVADLVDWLEDDARASRFDAIVAADVLVYFGDLGAPVRACARALRPGGVLVFSTERGAARRLRAGAVGRFSHDPRYVEAVAVEAGLELIESAEVSYRAEGGAPVAGTIVCLRRRQQVRSS